MTSILGNIISRVKFLHTAILLSGLLLFSCSPVKFVPEDKYLISKVQVEIDNEKMSKESARALVKQKENYKILGFFKFHLHVYNLSSKKKTGRLAKKNW